MMGSQGEHGAQGTTTRGQCACRGQGQCQTSWEEAQGCQHVCQVGWWAAQKVSCRGLRKVFLEDSFATR